MATALLVGKGNEQVREINERRNKYKKRNLRQQKMQLLVMRIKFIGQSIQSSTQV